MRKTTTFVALLVVVLLAGCKSEKGAVESDWPKGSGYLTPPQNKPSAPHKVEPISGSVKIIGGSNGKYFMQGTMQIRNDRVVTIYPGNTITHAYESKPSLEVSDYNGDKCVLLLGMTVKVDEYGQFVFVKHDPDEAVVPPPAPEEETAPQPKKTIRFPDYGIDVPIPQYWEIVDCSDLKSIDDLAEPGKSHLDEFVRKHPDRVCVLQQIVSPGPRPTIVLIPGDEFITSSPSDSSMRAGTTSAKNILAAQLAWLVISREKKGRIGGQVYRERLPLADGKVSAAKLKGDVMFNPVTMYGAVITGRGKGLKITVGCAGHTPYVDETVAALGRILVQIDKDLQKK